MATSTAKPATIFTKWDTEQRRNVRVPAGTPGAIEFLWCDSLDRYITIPGRD